MAEQAIELPQVDELPDEWIDAEDDSLGGIVPTDEEAEEGRRLGEEIDPNDDADNGGI